MLSSTIRRLDGGIQINADGLSVGQFIGIMRNGVMTPMPTIAAAAAAATSGDVIQVGPGTYKVMSVVALPAGVKLNGAGVGATTLMFYETFIENIDGGVCIELGQDSTLSNLTIDCYYRGSAGLNITGTVWEAVGGRFQACVGVRRGATAKAAVTNFLVENVEMLGETDCVYFRNANAFSGRFVNCQATTMWDAIAIFGPSGAVAHKIYYIGCHVRVMGPNTITGSTTRGNTIAIGDYVGGFQKFVGCYFRVTGASSGNILNHDSPNSMTHIVHFSGCMYQNESGVIDLSISGDANKLVYADGTNVDLTRCGNGANDAAVIFSNGFGGRYTTAQRDAIECLYDGLTIYNTTTKKLNFYDGTATAWKAVTSA